VNPIVVIEALHDNDSGCDDDDDDDDDNDD